MFLVSCMSSIHVNRKCSASVITASRKLQITPELMG